MTSVKRLFIKLLQPISLKLTFSRQNKTKSKIIINQVLAQFNEILEDLVLNYTIFQLSYR